MQGAFRCQALVEAADGTDRRVIFLGETREGVAFFDLVPLLLGRLGLLALLLGFLVVLGVAQGDGFLVVVRLGELAVVVEIALT